MTRPEPSAPPPPPDLPGLVRRWTAVVAAGLLIVAVALLLWYALPYLLILFAGLLVASFLDALSAFVGRWTRLRRGWALTVVVLLLLAVCVGVGFWMGPRIASQAAELSRQLPLAWGKFRDWLAAQSWFEWIARRLPSPSSAIARAGLGTRVGGYASDALAFFIDVGILLFFGLFVAARPKVYADGIVLLVTPRARPRVRQVLTDAAAALRWWLLGRIVSMTIIGVLDGIGLWLLGVPLPVSLGVIAGLLTFLPNVGPVLSTVPAVLLALTRPEHPWLPLWVVALKIGVQMVESYAVTPFVQRRALHLPPAMTLGVQFLLGALAGLPGLALAVPLTAMTIVIVRRLYVEDVLGDRVGPTPQ
jgi:predicted PurR-regulated permease PerM